MQLNAYSVFDNKAIAFIPPFFMVNDAVAIRNFADAVNDPTHAFHKNPDDYVLYRIGSFDDSVGVLEPLVNSVNLGLASSFKNSF